jgi:SAM-dependent methyltransferase
MNCRFCQEPLTHTFIDLGHQPPANSFLTAEQLCEPETYYPLKVYVCTNCWLVQIPESKKASEIFRDDYVYMSSTSESWVQHAKEYVDMIVERLGLNENSFIMEVGCNDGYLLQHVEEKGIPCLGFEPSDGPFIEAVNKGITCSPRFFGEEEAKRISFAQGRADLICGINVLAHQPDINDFVRGLKIALKPGGTVTMEFPSLQRLVEGGLWDTIYHEHYSYFSLITITNIFKESGLSIYDVEELPTHGGSFRVYAKHKGEKIYDSANMIECHGRTNSILDKEYRYGLRVGDFYASLAPRAQSCRREFMNWLLSIPCDQVVVGYGAAAKANTFLNYCGVRADMLPFVADKSPQKVGKFMPGSHIPVISIEQMMKIQPDYIVILAWNLKEEIMKACREWGAKFVVAMPRLEVI